MKKTLILILLIVPVLLVNAAPVQAAGLIPCGGPNEPFCNLCYFFDLINNLIKFFLFTIALPVTILMFVLGGVLFLFAGAKPELMNKAKAIITAAVIGLVLMFGAWIMVNTVLQGLGIIAIPEVLKWYDITCWMPVEF